MIILDIFFFKIYCFLVRLKKNEGDAKWSAFLYSSAYFAILLILLVYLIGLLFYNNAINSILRTHPSVFFAASFILSPLLMGVRYYRKTDIASIEKFYNVLSREKRLYFNIVTYILIVAIPILMFIFFRWYVFGWERIF